MQTSNGNVSCEFMIYDCIVIGAGWAGLASAFSLCEQGKNVLVLEASPYIGGRARKVSFKENIVDNGQHLLIGAYTNIRDIIKSLNISEDDIFFKTPMKIVSDLDFSLKTPNLPEPLNFLIGLLKTKGLSLKEKINAILFVIKIKKLNSIDFTDISVIELLNKHKQSLKIIKKLWEPLALAALSTPIEKASAKNFINVLLTTFKTKKGSTFYFPKTDLSNVLPNPIENFLNKNNCQIFTNNRVLSIDKVEDVDNLILINTAKSSFKAKKVIIATPPNVAANLLSNIENAKSIFDNLNKFDFEPITTVYIKYKNVPASLPMIGLDSNPGQWLFNRDIFYKDNILAVIITGNNDSLTNKSELIIKIHSQIKGVFPSIENYLEYKIITEKRAAFSCIANIDLIRPENNINIKNVYIAGDYTNTKHPATLEGAVLSGLNAAKLCII